MFNSLVFLFLFLPVTLIIYFAIGKWGNTKITFSWLVVASLVFYGWWAPGYLGLMLISILFNYAIGVVLGGLTEKVYKKIFLIVGITGNFALLGYFKYANFLVNSFNEILSADYHLVKVILPLAISYYTLQQIAFLVDIYKGKTQEPNFLHYCLFVTFFPQLLAGPIVFHKEILPQFTINKNIRLDYDNLAIGITIFSIGLLKKVYLADGFIKYVDPSFNAAEAGIALNFFEAWGGALAYTFRLYFDFSGYSDMAIGLARMFGILLPLNFDSPYKATSIIDFWRRWHLTLSRFLRDYIYIPLGGNRRGKARQYAYLMITMLLGGLWHGAGWTFVFWGGLHGFYLIINHAWIGFSHRLGHGKTKQSMYGRWRARLITFIAVVVGWVFFRAESFDGAMGILFAMFGGNGIVLPEKIVPGRFISAFFLVWFAPNSQQILSKFKPALEVYAKDKIQWQFKWLQWEPNWVWLFIVVTASILGVWGKTDYSQFVYFNF